MTTINIKTAKEAYQQAATKTMHQVLELLEWNEQEFANERYNNGRAYLYWYLVQDKERALLEISKLYWQWWKNLCNRHDYAFVTDTHIAYLPLAQRRQLYNDVHCPRTLAVECKIDAIVLSSVKIKKVATNEKV